MFTVHCVAVPAVTIDQKVDADALENLIKMTCVNYKVRSPKMSYFGTKEFCLGLETTK